MVRIFLTYCFAFLAVYTMAQSEYVKISASKIKVEENEVFRIAIESNVTKNFIYDFPDEFNQAGGSLSQEHQSIDMNTRQAILFFSDTYTFVVREQGKYKVGPVKVQGKNGEIESNVIYIEVVEPINLISANPAENLNENFFGIIQQSATEIYEGEPLVLSSKLYAQQELFTLIDYQSFIFEGSAEEHFLQPPGNFQRDDETVAHRKLEVISGGKVLLFPEQSGEYDLEPFKVAFSYRLKNTAQVKRGVVTSNRSSVVVKPLPNGAPANFIGAVGQFNISAQKEDKKLKVGDVFEYRIKVTGTGNLHNIETPKLNLPKGITLYGDPEVQDSVFFTSRGAEGSITFVYNLQVLDGKSFELDGLDIAYFNPVTESYEVAKSNTLKVKAKGKSIHLPEKKTEKEEPKEELRTILVDASTPTGGNDFYNSPLFWTGVGTPISLAFVFGFFVKYRNENEEEIEVNSKKKKAKKQAIELLETAKTALGNGEQEKFYVEIDHALKSFFAYKGNVDLAQVTRAYIAELQQQGAITKEQLTSVQRVLDRCDEARYGFVSERKNQEELLQTTQHIVNELNNKL